MIESTDLPRLWAAPDNSRLTSKQYSFRLPVHVAAKITALCDLYRNRSRTEIVGDLLSAALQEVEKGFPLVQGREAGPHPQTGDMLYEDIGPGAQYRKIANRYYIEIEKGMGNDKPKPLFG